MSESSQHPRKAFRQRVRQWAYHRRLKRNWQFYTMLLLPVAWYFIFCYMPMYGILIGFKQFKASLGIWDSKWVGFTWFQSYFTSPYFGRTLYNTFILSFMSLLCGFPLPILLALLLEEVSSRTYRKFVQNVTYIPHFLSTVVIVGLITSFTNRDYGIVNQFFKAVGLPTDNWMQVRSLFRPLYIGSGVWQNMGWDSIIYIAALSGIDPQLHEAAKIDGANKAKCMWYINLPCILPTIVTMLILNSGHILSVGFEKVYLMQNSITMSVSDVIATYVYKVGIQGLKISLTTAVGLFQSVVGLIFLLAANAISRKLGERGIW